MRVSQKRRGVAGIFLALIIFSLLFSVGASYFVYTNGTSVAANKANAVLQDAIQQQREENLLISVVSGGGGSLVLSAFNVGGLPTTISSIYLVNATTGQDIIPSPGPSPFVSTTLTPLTLNVGASTSAIGSNIPLNGYTYKSGILLVKVVTQRGNTFSARFPPLSNSGVGGDVLVVTMVATPTPPLTQVFTCAGCVTLKVTVYNFANSPVTGVSLSPPTLKAPWWNASGTATLSGGTCGAPAPSANLPAYSGSGTPTPLTITCTYNANTGMVGGFASFSAYLQGTLNGNVIISAEGVSNNIQIGGNSNVPTQGAFSINFFFLKSSSCTNGPSGSLGSYKYTSACTTSPNPMPPASLSNLPSAADISASGNYYVAFYVQITNNYPAQLAVLQYSFIQLDASHPPPSVGNETDFWLAGAASTYNANGYALPNYCKGGGSPACLSNNLPTLAAYTGNQVTCAGGDPSHNCIDINFGQSVTLTLAACGYGATNWDWGGKQYAGNFDNSNGCSSSAPGFANLGSANVLTLVISFLYNNQIYTQDIQYQGLAVTP